nr:facilitated trehalose transporter Tret1-2 homolog [Maniola hyperantus]
MVIAYVILAISRNVAMLYIGRFMVGVGGGAINVMNLVYIGEISSASIRGILLTTIGVFMTVGSIVLYATGPYISYHGTTYIALAISVIFLFCLFFIPESPIFFALQDRDEELRKVLQDLGRFEDIDETLKTKKELNSSKSSTIREWIELFTVRSNRKALFIVVIINILQHCSGILPVVFFSAAIFDMAGSSIESGLAMIIVVCFQLSGSIVTPFFIESVGRKKILIMSCALCSLSMVSHRE